MRSIINNARLERTVIMGADYYDDERLCPDGAPPVGIGDGTQICRAIVDKNARIGKNCRITNDKGLEGAEGDGWAIRDGAVVVVVAKKAIIQDGTVI